MSYSSLPYNFGTLNDVPISLKPVHVQDAEVLHNYLIKRIEYEVSLMKINRKIYQDTNYIAYEIYPLAEIQKVVYKALTSYRAKQFQSTVINKKKKVITKQLSIRLKFSLWLVLNENLNTSCPDHLGELYLQIDQLVLNTMPQLFPTNPDNSFQND